ncbi:hypothetical protein NDU88_008789 [Pleurodeles waltl]|uniref:Uncharacterized protein n=1 Tax=Pleurodeles waltl TaxID=8319 RepID=A0AAV7RXW7_PLEWA|nr:hypothetical protein NDU88_008789 [Pleurodeles waltl]
MDRHRRGRPCSGAWRRCGGRSGVRNGERRVLLPGGSRRCGLAPPERAPECLGLFGTVRRPRPGRPAGGAVARCAGELPERENSGGAADAGGATWVRPLP